MVEGVSLDIPRLRLRKAFNRLPVARQGLDANRSFTADPGDLESRWKLMRALYFRGEYVVDGHEEKLEIFARGRRLGEEGIDQLAERAGGRASLDEMAAAQIGRLFEAEPNAAGIYLWTGIHWGLWGRERGKLAAARRGVVGKVRDYAEIAVAIDPRFDNAGGHRVLGRLHAEAPRIPFITGWVDHQRSIRELERSLELVPSSILSELFLIEALLDYDRTRHSEALERLTRLVERPPDVGYVVEDLNALADARSLLERWSDRR